MIKKLILVLTCCFFSITAPRIVEHPMAQEMRSQVVSNFIALPAEQQQLIANLLYFSHEFSAIDAQVRDLVSEILFDFWNLKKNTLEYNNTAILMEQCGQKLKQLEPLIEKQRALYACWKACTLHVDQITDETFTLALDEFQNAMQEEIGFHASYTENEFNEHLQNYNQSLLKCHEQTGYHAQLIDTLQQEAKGNDMPHETVKKISLTSNLSNQTEKILAQVMLACNNIAAYENNLQKNTHRILNIYYHTMREQLTKPYDTIIFDQDGFIIPEKRCYSLPVHG